MSDRNPEYDFKWCPGCGDFGVKRALEQAIDTYTEEFEIPLGDNDIKLGEIGGVPFYMNGDQYEKWKHTDLTIDAVKGIGGMFSLDNGTGKRFLTKSEICLVVDNEDKKN